MAEWDTCQARSWLRLNTTKEPSSLSKRKANLSVCSVTFKVISFRKLTDLGTTKTGKFYEWRMVSVLWSSRAVSQALLCHPLSGSHSNILSVILFLLVVVVEIDLIYNLDLHHFFVGDLWSGTFLWKNESNTMVRSSLECSLTHFYKSGL